MTIPTYKVGDIIAWSPRDGGTGKAVVVNIHAPLEKCVRLFKTCLEREAGSGLCGCYRGLIEFIGIEEIDGPERVAVGPMPKWVAGNIMADGSGQSLPPVIYRPKGEYTIEEVKVLGFEDVDNEYCRKHGIEPAWDCIGDSTNVDCDWEPEGDDWGECPHDGFPLNDHAMHFARMANGEAHCLACAAREVLQEAA